MAQRLIDPIVSTDWLASHLATEKLAVIDLRAEEAYAQGHIPGAISVPFAIVSAWADCTDELLLELPPVDGLFKVIGDCGLTAESKVVVVGRNPEPPEPAYPLADPLRVGSTLIYAGITQVAVLSGGHSKWVTEGRPTTTEAPVVAPTAYTATVDSGTWVSTSYVEGRIGSAVLIDGRDPDQYFGASIDPFAEMRGHIPTARCLPMVCVWEHDGTFRKPDFIEGMVTGVVGAERDREIIAYCGVGGYAASWWFLLTQQLGYTHVKIYDGSMEAWVKEHDLVRYSWTG
jgi:thiosulfate/3-mercaptopyruvate sulfurtransferase